MSKRFRLFAVIFVAMLVVDQIVKVWVREAFAPGQMAGYPLPGVLELTLMYNKGIAFGMLQGLGVYLTPIAVVIAFLAGLYSYRHPQESPWMHVSLALIASGALGNLYDRLVLGQVTDMFSLRFINFPVFNVADSCITVGATIMVLHGTWEAVQSHRHPAPAPTEDASSVDPVAPAS